MVGRLNPSKQPIKGKPFLTVVNIKKFFKKSSDMGSSTNGIKKSNRDLGCTGGIILSSTIFMSRYKVREDSSIKLHSTHSFRAVKCGGEFWRLCENNYYNPIQFSYCRCHKVTQLLNAKDYNL